MNILYYYLLNYQKNLINGIKLIKKGETMSDAMFDLLYIIDTVVRVLMMLSIMQMTIYFIRYFKECAKKKYESLEYGRIHNEK